MTDRSLILAGTAGRRAAPGPWLPRDVRLRLLAAPLLAFSCAAVTSPVLVPAILALALAIAWAAGMAAGGLLRTLRLPGLVVLTLVVLLPFIGDGPALARLGPLTVQADGLTAAGLIGGRALAIVILAVALLGRIPADQLFAGLRALGVPALMVDIAVMMQRYLIEIRRDLAAMHLAVRLRGQPWRLRLGTLRAFGWTLAALLLRSHERAERIWIAMRLRGYGAVAADPLPAPERADWLRLAALLLPAAALPLIGLLT